MAEIKKQGGDAGSLEDAFIALTGRAIREQEGDDADMMRLRHGLRR